MENFRVIGLIPLALLLHRRDIQQLGCSNLLRSVLALYNSFFVNKTRQLKCLLQEDEIKPEMARQKQELKSGGAADAPQPVKLSEGLPCWQP